MGPLKKNFQGDSRNFLKFYVPKPTPIIKFCFLSREIWHTQNSKIAAIYKFNTQKNYANEIKRVFKVFFIKKYF